ncbi:MAG TPA: hypothetical protein PKL09_01570 [bacterium]|nr:hypothetical protein [bacterium]HNS33638.1 hypothetical protein [bacterium]HNZ73218.1 hypothetical protein [bacterium]HQA64087.1 hypothetical protein [bacterium]
MSREKITFATGLDANAEPAADELTDQWLKKTFGHSQQEIKESYRENRSRGESNERDYSQEKAER